MKFNKVIWISVSLLLPIIALLIWLNPLEVYAWWWSDDTEEAAIFLQNHSEWLQLGSFLSVIGHTIAWWIVKGLYLITSLLGGLIPDSLNLLDFLGDAGLDDLTVAIINDLVITLMILTITFLGFKTIVAKEPPNFKSVGVNILLSAFLIIGLPSLMDTMEELAIGFFDATQTGNNNDGSSNLAWSLIQENTADLVYVADTGFDLIENGSDNTKKK